MNYIKLLYPLVIFLLIFSCSDKSNVVSTETTPPTTTSISSTNSPSSAAAITPYSANPQYWAYEGTPVMLLGGSKNDNLFQVSNLKNHLDVMHNIGANYVRNTMSSRDEGNVKAFARSANGQYDLNRFNPEYWQRFENLLQWTAERDIIVQIELWDQWDHNEDRWNSDPWNPDQNVNYSTSDTRLKGNGNYGNVLHNNQNKHDLFLTVPKLNNDEAVLSYQKKFIDKVLSISLRYNNVLYTITNELFRQHSVEWSFYWMDYINKKAAEAGKTIQVTEMFQDLDMSNPQIITAFNNPGKFKFADASQNSNDKDQQHWNNLQTLRSAISEDPRPINHTKIYGADELGWTGGDVHGIERFWRYIIGGAASARFHRPTGGIGLSNQAQTQIRSARMLLAEFNVFKAAPDVNSSQLNSRSSDEAYLASIPGQQYAVYFPANGSVQLDLSNANGSFELKWLNINASSWSSSENINGGTNVTLQTPGNGSWVALITSD